MANPLLIILRVSKSNYPHMENIQFMVLMVDDHIRTYMPDLNDEDYLPPVTELKDNEYKEGAGDYYPLEYLSDDEYLSDTEDGITYQDNNRLGGKILSLRNRYKPLLEYYYHRE